MQHFILSFIVCPQAALILLSIKMYYIPAIYKQCYKQCQEIHNIIVWSHRKSEFRMPLNTMPFKTSVCRYRKNTPLAHFMPWSSLHKILYPSQPVDSFLRFQPVLLIYPLEEYMDWIHMRMYDFYTVMFSQFNIKSPLMMHHPPYFRQNLTLRFCTLLVTQDSIHFRFT